MEIPKITEPVSTESEVDSKNEAYSELVREYLDRYRFALKYLEATSRVLDCGCGNGHGADFLSKLAEDVLAVDASKESVQFCRARYASTGIRFEVGDAQALPTEDASIDVYTCFETIEFVAEPEKLLSEAKRVLAPHGVLLISTMNRAFTGTKPEDSGPAHLHDWSIKEFHALLSRFFPQVRHFVQSVDSPNKFHPKYIVSRGKQLMGFPDVTPLRMDEKSLQTVEEGRLWTPMTLISACRLSR